MNQWSSCSFRNVVFEIKQDGGLWRKKIKQTTTWSRRGEDCPNCGHQRPLAHPQVIVYVTMKRHGGMMRGQNRKRRRETCPSATLSATNPTRADPDANPGLRGQMPATNRQLAWHSLNHHMLTVDTVLLDHCLYPHFKNVDGNMPYC
jgi:hypothetical protein